MNKRQSEQDKAAFRAWGSRGVRRFYWRFMGWWYSAGTLRLWAAVAVCALVLLAILVSLP